MTAITEWQHVTAETFVNDIRSRGQPAVLRGLVADWPAVAASKAGDAAFLDYMRAFADARALPYAQGAPDIDGRFHYNAAMTGGNFEQRSASFSEFCALLLSESTRSPPAALAMQGLTLPSNLPGFHQANAMKLVPEQVVPRLWIGNRIKVATHYDPSENIACVIAGRRRFTVLPPDQFGNLYIGPLHITPAGTPVSMVHLTKPDLARYPRFAEALKVAQTVVLNPGDALYLPYLWFHHVESLDSVSAMVNYWWDAARADIGSPWDAMLHGMMTLRNLPAEQRRAWREMFDHYVFQMHGDPGAHLPPQVRGILGATTPKDVADMREAIIRKLSAASAH